MGGASVLGALGRAAMSLMLLAGLNLIHEALKAGMHNIKALLRWRSDRGRRSRLDHLNQP